MFVRQFLGKKNWYSHGRTSRTGGAGPANHAHQRIYDLILFDLPLNLSPIALPEHRRQGRPVDGPGRVAPMINNIITVTAVAMISFIMVLYPFCSSSSLPCSLAEYQEYLIDYYSSPYPLYSKPVISINRPEQPIDLVLVREKRNQDDKSFHLQKKSAFEGNVNQIQNQATSVNPNQIGSLNGGKTAAHFVLIEGSPGIGKSTLCWQLCRLWRENKMLHKWDLMVVQLHGLLKLQALSKEDKDYCNNL